MILTENSPKHAYLFFGLNLISECSWIIQSPKAEGLLWEAGARECERNVTCN